MDAYETLLKKAYEKIKVVQTSGDRFEIPKVSGSVEGKTTVINNITAIASYLRRDLAHLAKYLQKELATPGKIDNNRLILSTKLNSERVNEKVQQYAKEFVICPVCTKPDTEIITEKNIKFKHCLACGAKSPVKSKV